MQVAPGDAVIRSRTDDDLDACVEIARVVRARDGYPPYLPDGDLRRFIVSYGVLGAWVAVVDRRVVGHVALHRESHEAVTTLVGSALGVADDAVAVVARLFVAPEVRGRGVGRALLDHAAHEARVRGLVPVLDVAVELAAAVALYESAGWTRIGSVVFAAPDGTRFEEHVYVAPVEDDG